MKPLRFWRYLSFVLSQRIACRSITSVVLLALIVMGLPAVSAAQENCSPDGDVDQNGSVTAADALLVFQQALGLAQLSTCQQSIADVYPLPTAADGTVTAADALCIFQKALSLASCLDVMAGQPIAEPISFQADPATPYIEYQLMGTDPDGDVLTYELLDDSVGTGYANAAVGPQSGILYLTVVAGFAGEIVLHYRVTDGQLFSAPATVRIHVEFGDEDQGLGSISIAPEEYATFESANRAGPAPLPEQIDLSPNFPAPGNQRRQNSCVGWATAYAVKSFQERLEMGWEFTTSHLFSPAFIYNQINEGRDRGSFISDALQLIVDDGAASMATMPYVEHDYLTPPSAAAREEAATFKGAMWMRVNGSRDVKAYLADKLPVVIGMQACENLQTLKPPAVYNMLGVECGGHAVVITGYDDNRFGGAFRIINSWGQERGDGGYFWLPYDLFREAVSQAYILIDADNTAPVVPPVLPPTPEPSDDLPNLQVRDWEVSYDPRPRGEGRLHYTVINTGTAVAPSGADVNFVLSEDQRININDHFVVWETIPVDLEPGESVYRDESNPLVFSFPDGLPSGTYWMAVWVDDFDYVEESREDDNVSIGERQVTIENTLPDLYVRSWYAEWDDQGDGALTYRVENIGKSPVHHGDWDINLVLSLDEIIGNDDEIFLFYEASEYALDPDSYVYRDESNPAYFNIYQDHWSDAVPSGVYYMALWVDDRDNVGESNELNNYSLGGNQVQISYGASSPVVAADGSRESLSTRARALMQQSQLFQPSRQALNRLYNGHELPAPDVLVQEVRIERTPQGGMSLSVVADGTSTDGPPPSLSENSDEEFPAHAQQRRSADTIIFPVVEEFAMPQSNPTRQGGK